MASENIYNSQIGKTRRPCLIANPITNQTIEDKRSLETRLNPNNIHCHETLENERIESSRLKEMHG